MLILALQKAKSRPLGSGLFWVYSSGSFYPIARYIGIWMA
jgi:hypothetical protein